MRRALAAAALAGALAGCWSRDFRVSGTITVAANIQHKLPKTNAVMFIVAKNLGGVPVAVHRIVNPQFPVDYALNAEDLVVPGSRPAGPLTVEVEMNTRGDVGHPVRGDFRGAHPDRVSPGDRGVHIVIDRQL